MSNSKFNTQPAKFGEAVAVVAEKPAVARDIAKVLGATRRGKGYLYGNGYVITWALGHLVGLAMPGEMRPQWNKWRRDALPMLPAQWPLVVSPRTRDQFQIVKRILNGKKVRRVVCATDAGREGELIFRYIAEAAGCPRPVQRLWISSLTPEAIRKGFQQLQDGHRFDALADAARGRSRADWLVGMNLSRAYTLEYGDRFGGTLSVGRVQTPTLALVVERELAIRAFVPEDYLEVEAGFRSLAATGQGAGEGAGEGIYTGTWFRGAKFDARSRRLPADGEEAKRIIERVRSGRARVESVQGQTRRLPPPLLYDLTELQRHANRLFGFSASKTLSLAQDLYEKHKLISYPRTDSRYLSADVAATLPGIVQAIQGAYAGLLAEGTGQRPPGRRFVNDAKVSDHHAIIPTNVGPGRVSLTPDQGRIYDLICRRLLSAWHRDHVFLVTTVITAVESSGDGAAASDRFHSSGTAIEQQGWKVLDLATRGKGGAGGRRQAGTDSAKAGGKPPDQGGQRLPPGLKAGLEVEVVDAKAVEKRTRPPPRFTEATLLTAMESAGKTLQDKELSDAMKENGLGTPATRAETIETLLRREYLLRKGKLLEATEKGIRLIECVHPQVKSAEMTGRWEARLKAIQRGDDSLAAFQRDIERYVAEVVRSAPAGLRGRAAPVSALSSVTDPLAPVSAPPPAAGPAPAPPASTAAAGAVRSPTPADGLHGLLARPFGLAAFRPFQEPVCRDLVAGRDALLVLPTGAGKSLCYQLAGLARAGTTLVFSALDTGEECERLRAFGLQAGSIHAGLDREASRAVCRRYLHGELDYLFIHPERLGVEGFAPMLAKGPACLVAVKEAHCLSPRGHDPRPEYALLARHLPLLRPAPVLALSATATERVQGDIVEQLRLILEHGGS